MKTISITPATACSPRGRFESVGYEFKPSAANTGYDDRLRSGRSRSALSLPLRGPSGLRGNACAPLCASRSRFSAIEIPATKEVIDRYVGAIQRMVGDKRESHRQAELRCSRPAHHRVPRPTRRVRRSPKCTSPGTKCCRAARWLSTLAEVAIGTAYSETTMRSLLDSSIRPLYDARGRIRVAFPKIAADAGQ